MKRIYHNYLLWEEYKFGMWNRNKDDVDKFLQIAIDFTGNSELYGSFMIRVVDEWKYSCEQNLTDLSINRKAWIGHAACCLFCGCPEWITRMAWNKLDVIQQKLANKKANIAIKYFEEKQRGYKCQNYIQMNLF